MKSASFCLHKHVNKTKNKNEELHKNDTLVLKKIIINFKSMVEIRNAKMKYFWIKLIALQAIGDRNQRFVSKATNSIVGDFKTVSLRLST